MMVSTLNRPALLALFVIGLLLTNKVSAAETKMGLDKSSQPIIRIRHVRTLENPRPDGRGEANSYILKGKDKRRRMSVRIFRLVIVTVRLGFTMLS